MKHCNSCGRCCEIYGGSGLSASAEDIAGWETHRPDIARYVRDGKLWIDPSTGDYFDRCPWLEQSGGAAKTFVCAIYDDRPEDCRHYPVTVSDVVRDGCEMLERRDLADLKRAQRALDAIMRTSRPAAGD